MTVQVTSKFGLGQLAERFSGMSLSEFVHQAPKMDIDFDMIIKIEVVE